MPGVIVAGTHHGFVDLDDQTVSPAINASKADILLIGMGTPKQDYWLWNYYPTFGSGHDDSRCRHQFHIGRKSKSAEGVSQAFIWNGCSDFFRSRDACGERYFLGIPKFMFYIFLQKVGRK